MERLPAGVPVETRECLRAALAPLLGADRPPTVPGDGEPPAGVARCGCGAALRGGARQARCPGCWAARRRPPMPAAGAGASPAFIGLGSDSDGDDDSDGDGGSDGDSDGDGPSRGSPPNDTAPATSAPAHAV